jgi:hypothetical protein
MCNQELIGLRERLALDGAPVIGLIVNRESTNPLYRLVDGRHWLALVRKLGNWWDVDSKLEQPTYVGDEGCLIDYLRGIVLNTDGQAFLVQGSE